MKTTTIRRKNLGFSGNMMHINHEGISVACQEVHEDAAVTTTGSVGNTPGDDVGFGKNLPKEIKKPHRRKVMTKSLKVGDRVVILKEGFRFGRILEINKEDGSLLVDPNPLSSRDSKLPLMVLGLNEVEKYESLRTTLKKLESSLVEEVQRKNVNAEENDNIKDDEDDEVDENDDAEEDDKVIEDNDVEDGEDEKVVEAVKNDEDDENDDVEDDDAEDDDAEDNEDDEVVENNDAEEDDKVIEDDDVKDNDKKAKKSCKEMTVDGTKSHRKIYEFMHGLDAQRGNKNHRATSSYGDGASHFKRQSVFSESKASTMNRSKQGGCAQHAYTWQSGIKTLDQFLQEVSSMRSPGVEKYLNELTEDIISYKNGHISVDDLGHKCVKCAKRIAKAHKIDEMKAHDIVNEHVEKYLRS